MDATLDRLVVECRLIALAWMLIARLLQIVVVLKDLRGVEYLKTAVVLTPIVVEARLKVVDLMKTTVELH